MSFEIYAPSSPGTGFEIYAPSGGGPAPDEGGLIVFDLPSVPIGTVLLAFIVRDAPISTPSPGWTKLIDGNGASGRFLDVFAHEVDRSDADVQQVAFASVDGQEIHGYLLPFDGTGANTVIEAFAGAAFAATATPTAPATTSQQATSKLVYLFSADGAIDFSAPVGATVLDEYTTNEFDERTFFAVERTANATGVIAAVAAGASPNATGHAWTLVIRNHPPITPAELFDTVPGHIGLI